MGRTRYRHARVYATLRSAHLERAHRLEPASILYRDRRFDFDPALTTGLDLHQGGLRALLATVWRSRLTAVELNEPLFRTALGRTLAAVAVARLAARVHRQPVRLVSYAIENRDPFAGPPGTGRRARARAAVDRVLARAVARGLDRIAFGTSAAEQLYQTTLGPSLRSAATRVVPALPAACDDCPPAAPAGRGDRVLFLGAFTERKGLPQLLEAWPHVRSRRPTARLSLYGKGPLEEAARGLAAADPSVEVVVDAPRHAVHAALRGSAVVVLFSQPTPRWREQVGLPVVEALAHGCAVVTSDQTGLAEWLGAHGHDVLPATASPVALADRVVAALDRERPVASVVADLPAADGRRSADEWLFSVAPGRSTTAAG